MGREVHEFRPSGRAKPRGFRPAGQVVPFRPPAAPPAGRQAVPETRERGFAALLVTLFGFVAVVGYVAMPDSWFGGEEAAPVALVDAAGAEDALSARFGFCHRGGGMNCVVDGDTFWFRGEKIRIADIDTPETHPPRCADEARKGAAATRELHRQLNAGPFSLRSIDRDTDRYGRKLRVVTRGGQSVGGVLVRQGLARWYAGGRRGWC